MDPDDCKQEKIDVTPEMVNAALAALSAALSQFGERDADSIGKTIMEMVLRAALSSIGGTTKRV